MSIVIRPVKTIVESRMVEDLSMRVWEAGPESTVPDHVIITIAKNRGVVLLAFDGEQPVGFCLGFVGLTKELRMKHCSHQAGVLRAYQNSGLGYQLKVAQRKMVLGQGIDHVTWTFDPLETRNANLNLHKLGAVCRTYMRNVYGDIRDGLNAGLPTDRFLVDWWVKSEWVGSRIDQKVSPPTLSQWEAQGVPVLNAPTRNRDGYLVPPTNLPALNDARYYLVELPPSIQAIKSADISLAHAWRMHTRALFEEAFAQGYSAIDLLYENRRTCYLLEKEWQKK
ncbi:MAG: hypothetical protein ACPGWR_19675 [Ardenticatenaceae bacterium]